MAGKMNVRAKYVTNMQFEVDSGPERSVTLDGAHAIEGPDLNFSPMEMLLVSLAGCTGISVISVLQKKRQDVTAYEVYVSGTRAEEHPKVFLEIAVEHVLTGHNILPEAVRRSIELSETRYCGVSIMLGKTATITNTFRIIEAE